MKSYKTICINGKQKRLHRYLVEQNIGRELDSSEIVHHIDGNKHNNAIENLEVISRGEHLKIHLEDGTVNPYLSTTKYRYDDYNIEEMFLVDMLSAKDISKKINIPESSINYFLRKNNIKISDRKDLKCSCGEKAVYKKKSLCKKCYLKEYNKKDKNVK